MSTTLAVPPNALTTGMATAWVVSGCNQTDPMQAAFVEATIFNTQTNTFRVYHPLAIPMGTQPLAPPTPITIDPNHDVVGYWFGANGNTLTLLDSGGSLAAANCSECTHSDEKACSQIVTTNPL